MNPYSDMIVVILMEIARLYIVQRYCNLFFEKGRTSGCVARHFVFLCFNNSSVPYFS